MTRQTRSVVAFLIGTTFPFASIAFASQTQVADPVLSVSAGTSSSNVTVTVNDSTSGATIYYTTNGTTPTTSSSSISPGGTILLNLNMNLKVEAYQGSNNPSSVITSTYAANGLITSGGQHALALKSDGTVWAWGNNAQGQLGNGSTAASSPPVLLALTGTRPIVSVTSASMPFDNGLPVAWEIKYFGQTGNNPSSSPDGNGLTLLQDYQQGNDPTNYYSQNGTIITPMLTIVSGDGQNDNSSETFPLPLTVKVTNSSGVPLVNAPVTFTVGGQFPGLIYPSGGTRTGSPVTVVTNSMGQAYVYATAGGPAGGGGISTINATTGTATAVTFFEETISQSLE